MAAFKHVQSPLNCLLSRKLKSCHLMGFQLQLSCQCFASRATIPLFQNLVHDISHGTETANLHLRVFGREEECFFRGYNVQSIPVKQKDITKTMETKFLNQTAVPVLPIPLQKLLWQSVFPSQEELNQVLGYLFRSGAKTISLLIDFRTSAEVSNASPSCCETMRGAAITRSPEPASLGGRTKF